MAGPRIETLRKITYDNLEQFIQDINRNFAVVENSPLYKGIPGPDTIGSTGLSGVRGTKFIFIDLFKFQTQFINELSTNTQITLDYINTKLLTFDNKEKLLLSLNVTELVDKDVIVLSNTIMLYYDFIENKFVNSGISFNEQSNLLNNIQQQIETYVQYYVNNNQTINNLANVFQGYTSYAKNYADTNNTFITTQLTQSSVYSPYINGYNNNIGVLLNNHKYFGFSDTEFPKDNNGTIVFGSIKKYYELLMNTLSTSANQTLTSDYSPGVNNIPAAVFLQDTENAGLLIGYKGRENLKRFGSLYKNSIQELIIKSDSGINPSEFSELKLHKDYLKYSKLVQFGNNLEVSRDVSFFGDINNRYIKTGKYTTNANPTVVEIGSSPTQRYPNTLTVNIAKKEQYLNYLNNVLVTDTNGFVVKDYSIETTEIEVLGNHTTNPLLGLNPIVADVSSPTSILTSYYFGYLAAKMNAVTNFCKANYWVKNQFNTGVIPDLWLSNNLKVVKNVNLTGQILTDFVNNKTTFNAVNQDIFSENIFYDKFQNCFLFAQDGDGKLVSNYTMETSNLLPAELLIGNNLNIFSESTNNLISSKYYAHLAKKINTVTNSLNGNYWRKSQYYTGEIPTLYLSDGLTVNGNVLFKSTSLNKIIFQINKTTGLVELGNGSTPTILSSSSITLPQFTNKVLVTGPLGNLLNSYFIETNTFNNNELSENKLINETQIVSDLAIPKSSHINWLVKKINEISKWVTDKYWSKAQFLTGDIPSLWVSTSLRSDSEFIAGDNTNPNIHSNGSETELGKINGNTTLRGTIIKLLNRKNIVPVTDDNGVIISDYSIEKITPTSNTGNGQVTDIDILTDYWDKTAQPQDFLSVPDNQYKIVTSKYIDWLIKHIKVIRTLMFDRPTYSELNALLNRDLYIVQMWTNTMGPVPNGYVICDGRPIPGTLNIFTPNMTNLFVKGATPSNIGNVTGNINHEHTMTEEEMFPHDHQYGDIYYSEHSGTVTLPVGDNGSHSTDSDNKGLEIIRQTDKRGGKVINNVLQAKPFSIEPRTFAVFYIMKYWNGMGTVPTVNMPSFSTITNISITNSLLKISLNLNLVDNTVASFNVEGSSDNGTSYQILKIVNPTITNVVDILLPKNSDWLFRLRATSGYSYLSNGELSNIYSKSVFVPWVKIISIVNNLLSVSLTFNKVDNSTNNMIVQASIDNTTWTDCFTGLVPVNNVIVFNLPSYNNNWKFRLKAVDGNVITNLNGSDDYSDVYSQAVNLPTNFATIKGFNTTSTLFNIYLTLNIDTTTIRLEYKNTFGNWIIVNNNILYPNTAQSNVNVVISRGGLSLPSGTHIRLKALDGIYSNAVNYPIGQYSSEYIL